MSVINLPSSALNRAHPFSQPVPFQWTRDEYYRMADAGLFQDRRVQLIEGQVIEMPPQNEPHAMAITLTDYALRPVFAHGFTIRIQLPLHLSDRSEPEPDIAVVTGSPRDYRTGHPATAALVIEVSDATLDFDRRTKLPLYAAANVPEYWIVNVADRRLEVFRTPANLPAPNYTQSLVLSPTDSISPLAAPRATIIVANLLP